MLEKPIERAERWDIYVQQGSTFKRELVFVGMDLTGMSFRGQIRRSPADSTVLGEFAFELEGTNILTISLPHTVTQALPAGRWQHDIEFYIDQPGYEFVARVLEGRVEVDPEITRD